MTPILETNRFILRQFTLADAPLIIALNTPIVLKYVHEPLPKGIADAERIIQEIILPQYALYQLGRFAVIRKETGDFVGWCGLKFLQEENEIDLGYRFLEKEWGKGIATETANACIKFGFVERYLEKIIGRAHIENIASQKVLEKAGLVFESELLEEEIPIKKYSLTAAQYQQKKEGN